MDDSSSDSSSSSSGIAAMQDQVTPAPLGEAGFTTGAAHEGSKKEASAAATVSSLKPPLSESAARSPPPVVDISSSFSAEPLPLGDRDAVRPLGRPAGAAPEKSKEVTTDPSTPWAFAEASADSKEVRAGTSTVRWFRVDDVIAVEYLRLAEDRPLCEYLCLGWVVKRRCEH